MSGRWAGPPESRPHGVRSRMDARKRTDVPSPGERTHGERFVFYYLFIAGFFFLSNFPVRVARRSVRVCVLRSQWASWRLLPSS